MSLVSAQMHQRHRLLGEGVCKIGFEKEEEMGTMTEEYLL